MTRRTLSGSESAAATVFFCTLARHVHYDTQTWAHADTVGHEAGYTSEQIETYTYMLNAAGLVETSVNWEPSDVERVLIRLTIQGREYARTVCTDGY